MFRLHISTRDDAPVESKPVLDVVCHKLGVVPNFYRFFGSSPVALTAFAAFHDGPSPTHQLSNRLPRHSRPGTPTVSSRGSMNHGPSALC